ncbi:MAG: hypothetical protein WBA10_19850, partial [Elainellaceae cyanobacterium]
MTRALRRFSRIIPPVFGLAIVALCLWAIRQELGRYSLQDIFKSSQAIAPTALLTAIVLVVLSYL